MEKLYKELMMCIIKNHQNNLPFTKVFLNCLLVFICTRVRNISDILPREGKRLVVVIAWLGGQLRINFLSKILKFFCNSPNFRRGQLLRSSKSYEGN